MRATICFDVEYAGNISADEVSAEFAYWFDETMFSITGPVRVSIEAEDEDDGRE